jgi:hypothetical protein
MKPLQVQKTQLDVQEGQGKVSQIPAQTRLISAQASEAEAKARKESGQPVPLTPQQRADKLFQNDETLGTINQALELARSGQGTGWSAMLSGVPTTKSKLLANYIKTLKSNLTIDNMLALKNASSTGGTGFGNLSEKEGETLASTVTALDPSMDSKDVVDALNKVNNHYRRFRASIEGIDPNKIKFDPGQPPAVGTKRDRRQQPVIGPGSMTTPPGGPLAGPDDPLAPTALAIGNGATNAQIDPALVGVRRRVAGMVASGKSGSAIRGYLNDVGVDPAGITGIDAAVAFRKKNPGYLGSYPVDIGVRDLPMSKTRRKIASVGNSPFGAYSVGAANAASFGGLDEIVGMTGGDANLANAGKQGLSAMYPKATLAGDVTGGAATAALLEGSLAKAGLAGGKRLIAADTLYGGGYGAGENNDDRLGGAVMGAGTAIPGGMAGRGLAGATGRLATGVTNAGVRTLRDAGVPMTLGQIVSQGGLGGKIAKGFEDRTTGFLGLGDLVKARRTEGLQAYNQAGFSHALEPLGVPHNGYVGEHGVEDLRSATSAGFRNALNGVSVSLDPQFGFDLGNLAKTIRGIPGVGENLHKALSRSLPNYFKGGDLSGDGLQALLEHIRQIKSGYRNDPLYGAEIRPALNGLHDAVVGMVDRQVPDVMPAFRAAQQAYKRSKVIDKAVQAASNTDGIFTPAQLGTAAKAAANKYGDTAGTTRRPFFDLQRAGQNILPSKVPDSGTAGRLALPALGGAIGGGRGYLGSDKGEGAQDAGAGAAKGALLGALITGGLALPATKTGQRFLQSVLTAPRPAPVVNIGQIIRDQAKLGGFAGSPLALQYQNFGN